jgi:hypothetical protein
LVEKVNQADEKKNFFKHSNSYKMVGETLLNKVKVFSNLTFDLTLENFSFLFFAQRGNLHNPIFEQRTLF